MIPTWTWEQRHPALLCNLNHVYKSEEPFHHWNKARRLNKCSTSPLSPTCTELGTCRSERFQPLSGSRSPKPPFKWFTVNPPGPSVPSFTGTHVLPGKPLLWAQQGPSQNVTAKGACFSSPVFPPNRVPGFICSLLGTLPDKAAIEVAQCMHTVNMSTHHVHKLLQAMPNLPQRFFELRPEKRILSGRNAGLMSVTQAFQITSTYLYFWINTARASPRGSFLPKAESFLFPISRAALLFYSYFIIPCCSFPQRKIQTLEETEGRSLWVPASRC